MPLWKHPFLAFFCLFVMIFKNILISSGKSYFTSGNQYEKEKRAFHICFKKLLWKITVQKWNPQKTRLYCKSSDLQWIMLKTNSSDLRFYKTDRNYQKVNIFWNSRLQEDLFLIKNLDLMLFLDVHDSLKKKKNIS